MFVVTGATGNTGSVVANALLDAGKQVRAVVRDVSKESAKRLAGRGAELVVADLEDADALARAFRGAEGVYLVSAPDLRTRSFVSDKRKVVAGYATAVREANVPHVVLLSSVGAQHDAGTGPIRTLHEAERVLAATGAATTFVRAAYFVENWASVLPAAKADGVLPSFLPHALSIPMVATSDIGRVAAKALIDGPRGARARRVLELAGPSDPSPDDVAAAVSEILGRTVRVVEAPLDAVVPTFTSFGISEDVASLYREMYQGILSKTVAFEGAGAELVRGSETVLATLRPLLAS